MACDLGQVLHEVLVGRVGLRAVLGLHGPVEQLTADLVPGRAGARGRLRADAGPELQGDDHPRAARVGNGGGVCPVRSVVPGVCGAPMATLRN